MFNIGDVDTATVPILKYKCIRWKKLVTLDECLRYGNVLTDEQIHCFPEGKVG